MLEPQPEKNICQIELVITSVVICFFRLISSPGAAETVNFSPTKINHTYDAKRGILANENNQGECYIMEILRFRRDKTLGACDCNNLTMSRSRYLYVFTEYCRREFPC